MNSYSLRNSPLLGTTKSLWKDGKELKCPFRQPQFIAPELTGAQPTLLEFPCCETCALFEFIDHEGEGNGVKLNCGTGLVFASISVETDAKPLRIIH